MGFEAVIFDLDGTLYDFKGLPKHLILGSLWNMMKIRAERKARISMAGCDYGSAVAFESVFYEKLGTLIGKTPEDARQWYENFYSHHMVNTLKKHYKARPQLAEFFQSLRDRGIKIAVLSDYPLVRERLSAIGVEECGADLLASMFDYGALKPAARPFQMIAAGFGVMPEKCLVVGDRDDTDGEAARRARMQFVQILNEKPEIAGDVDSATLRNADRDHLQMSWSEFVEFAKQTLA